SANPRVLRPCPTRRSSDLSHQRRICELVIIVFDKIIQGEIQSVPEKSGVQTDVAGFVGLPHDGFTGCYRGAGTVDQRASEGISRSEEHTSELQSRENVVCR